MPGVGGGLMGVLGSLGAVTPQNHSSKSYLSAPIPVIAVCRTHQCHSGSDELLINHRFLYQLSQLQQ